MDLWDEAEGGNGMDNNGSGGESGSGMGTGWKGYGGDGEGWGSWGLLRWCLSVMDVSFGLLCTYSCIVAMGNDRRNPSRAKRDRNQLGAQ